MAKKLKTLTSRMILAGLALHAVLLPLLFIGQMHVISQSHEEGFVNDIRQYSRFLADVFEMDYGRDDADHITHLLDSAVLGSNGVFAELVDGNRHYSSSLSISVATDTDFPDDFSFGQHGDHIYFLSIPLDIAGKNVVLRMGFDEVPTSEQIQSAQQSLLFVMLAYLLMSIIGLVIVSAWMTGPLRSLQAASRLIAKGHHQHRIAVNTPLAEVNALASDLESMRYELVSVNDSLQQEMAEKLKIDDRRKALESKLQQAQKLETVGVMAGGISHEFNNILLPIFLYTEQAQHDLPEDSPVQKSLAAIHRLAERAKGLVEQILTFSRQDSKQEYKAENIRRIIEEAIELIETLIPSTIKLNRNLTVENSMVMADRDQIHQIIMNLGSNAFQAVENTKGEISIGLDRVTVDEDFVDAHPQLEAGYYVRIIIKDNGHGMDKNTLQRIFEPFYTTRAVGKGTGLGLSVVHGIATAHKGDIIADSQPGKGTVFSIYLPELIVDTTTAE